MQFQAPRSVAEVTSILANTPDARVLAGGTDLIVQMSQLGRRPAVIVDIKNIPELGEITEEGGGFRIGAAVCGAALAEHQALKAAWPGVVEAVDLIGSMQVQGRATPAGNLCNASPAADSVPAMIAAGATVTLVGPNGERQLAVEDVPTGPGTTSLFPGEFVVSVNLPAREPQSADAYLRLIPRTEMDIAVAGAAVNLSLDSAGTCTAARVAIGAVAPTALRVDTAAEALVGTALSDEALAAAATAASAACSPIDDKRGTVEYRREVVGVLVRRAARIAASRITA